MDCSLLPPFESVLDRTSGGEKLALEHRIKTLSRFTSKENVLSTYNVGIYESLKTLYRSQFRNKVAYRRGDTPIVLQIGYNARRMLQLEAVDSTDKEDRY